MFRDSIGPLTVVRHHIDFEAYYRRIAYSGEGTTTLQTLSAVMRCHVLHVPFENLDVQLGRPLTTSVQEAFDKIVTHRRGGWCYEQNGLFGAVLENLGFRVVRIAAHVMRAERGPSTRNSHLSLLVSHPKGDQWYLADVGFGGTLLRPIPFLAGEYVQAPFRLGLRKVDEETWQFHENSNGEEFSFDFKPEAGDEDALSEKCIDLQTDPASSFVQTLVVQKRLEDERWSLRGRIFKTESRDSVRTEK